MYGAGVCALVRHFCAPRWGTFFFLEISKIFLEKVKKRHFLYLGAYIFLYLGAYIWRPHYGAQNRSALAHRKSLGGRSVKYVRCWSIKYFGTIFVRRSACALVRKICTVLECKSQWGKCVTFCAPQWGKVQWGKCVEICTVLECKSFCAVVGNFFCAQMRKFSKKIKNCVYLGPYIFFSGASGGPHLPH